MIPKSFKDLSSQQQDDCPERVIIAAKEMQVPLTDLPARLEKALKIPPGPNEILSQKSLIDKDNSKSNQMNDFDQFQSEGIQLMDNDADVVWEWQSNLDPWGSEPAQWTPYSQLENSLLEEAYSKKQKEVDLGDYIVFISNDQDMIQQRKDNIIIRRRVRRTQKLEVIKIENKEKHRKQRFIGVETPKTYSNAFGNVEDFLQFFKHRGPEMVKFANKFTQADLAQDIETLNRDILPILIDCMEREVAKTPKKDEAKRIVKLFKKKCPTFQQFYGDILKVYTMETFLYKNLNLYLRNEDWTQLDCILPFAFCLCKAFLCMRSTSDLNETNETQKDENSKITLYRGAHLDEISLGFYNIKKGLNFSWNAVTSTSTNRNVAEVFMIPDPDTKRIPVLFVIESPAMINPQAKQYLIDIKEFSDYPEEEEIVLAPGSIFELIDFKRDDKGAEVRLRLVINVKTLAYQGKVLHGVMQYEMSTGTVSKIIGLAGNELTEAIGHLKGNRLIEEIDIALCKFDLTALEKLVETLPTIPKLTKFGFFCGGGSDRIVKALNKMNIQDLRIYDKTLQDEQHMIAFTQEIQSLTSLTTLHLSFSLCYKMTDETINNLCVQGIKNLTQLTTLHLDFSNCYEITDEGVNNLCSQGLRYLTRLTTLKVNFSDCQLITDKGVNSLASQGIRCLASLTSLNLDFSMCLEISDEGLNHLCSQGISYLTSLTVLQLYFNGCYGIADEGLDDLSCQGLRYLTSLTMLQLCFSGCQFITSKGINNLCLNGLRHLTSLTSLSLYFSGCNQITEEGVTSLCSQGIQHLISLTTLHIDFAWCSEITDEAVNNLCSQGIRYLVSLTTLILDFSKCSGISDEAVNSLCSQGIRHLTALTTLQLSFSECSQVTDDALKMLKTEADTLKVSLTLNEHIDSNEIITQEYILKRKFDENLIEEIDNSEMPILTSNDILNLSSLQQISGFKCKLLINELSAQAANKLLSEGITNMTSLATLHLDFSEYYDIRDEEVNSVCSDGIRNLTSLTALHLSFEGCSRITDEGISHLGSQGLRHMASLKTLYLYFSNSPFISGDAISNLCSQGIRHLTSLTALSLSFEGCYNIMDGGLNLCSQELRNLTSLTTLQLSFAGCQYISDKGIENLCFQGLSNLTSLTTLKLSLSGCQYITDEGINSLCSQGVSHLTSLTTLHLDFSLCSGITDEGVNSLCVQGIRCLTSLTDLKLSFTKCNAITDEGINHLCSQGLGYLTSLAALQLYFSECQDITDEGINSLCSQGIRPLTSLTVLHLDFSVCSGISLTGFKNLQAFLQYFGYHQ